MFRFVRKWLLIVVVILIFTCYRYIYVSKVKKESHKDVELFYSTNHSNYCVVYNYRKAENNSNFTYEPISLAIHSTPHYLYLLPAQVI